MSGRCPCGLEGVGCTDAVAPLLDAANALAQACVDEGTEECLVSENSAECNCICGFRGDFCEIEQNTELVNLILGFVIAFAFITFCGLFLFFRERKESQKSESEQGSNAVKESFVSSQFQRITPTVILIFRISAFIIFVAILTEFSIVSPSTYRTFTLWNWILLGTVFLFGIILSIKFLRDPSSGLEKAGSLERMFLVLQEIMLPSSFLVNLVLWLILYPSADAEGQEALTRPAQFFVHGVNSVLLTTEFVFNKTVFVSYHVLYAMIFAGIYLIFHQIYLAAFLEGSGEPPCPVYFFLDMSNSLYPGFVFGLLAVFISIFYIFFGLSEMKKKYLLK